ncbi:hypothetical protein NXS98_09550 [Fontisphaera persica]|uniref:hypothetical protein n=1 Tax=Fontisphaera persica TaxID=2974023 RepID=UPI0024BFE559|nr:hypothetical protein [Fontisphaera persica]WCJ57972.1 hypothetical protein NXS98_09550 [Fontisphaera persica]
MRLTGTGWHASALWLTLLGAGLAPAATSAPAPAWPKLLSIESQSRQFVAQGPPEILPSPAYINQERRTNFVLLNQANLAVWAERVKQALLRELDSPDAWRGRIFINLYRAADLGEPVTVKAQYTPQGWFYQLHIPSEVEPVRLNRALVAVLLQEMADRQAGTRAAELPPWLARGLGELLELRYGATFRVVPDAGRRDTATVRVERRLDPLGVIRQRLAGREPLPVDELNWPPALLLNEPPGEYYDQCAHLFVLSLLRLPDGPACLRRYLQEHAARHLNWQTGFLQAFASHFKNMRDVDKWWNVQIATVTGRDQANLYSVAESWRKLEEILACPVQVKGEDGRPQRQQVSLQTVIEQWETGRQRAVLRQKIGQLQMLRARVAPPLLRLTEDYLRVLQTYLGRRERAVFAADAQAMMTDNPRLLARRTAAQLNQLDIVRADLKAATLTQPAAPSPAEAAGVPRP